MTDTKELFYYQPPLHEAISLGLRKRLVVDEALILLVRFLELTLFFSEHRVQVILLLEIPLQSPLVKSAGAPAANVHSHVVKWRATRIVAHAHLSEGQPIFFITFVFATVPMYASSLSVEYL